MNRDTPSISGGPGTELSTSVNNPDPKDDQNMADQNIPVVTEQPDQPQSNWIWAEANDSRWNSRGHRPPFMAVRTSKTGATLSINLKARKELGIENGGKIAIGYDAAGDCLGIQPNASDERAIHVRHRDVSIGRWLISNFGFRLLDKETYRIEKNDPGTDPPYIIPLNGRRRPA